jgi:hypothetical protein
MRIYNLRPLLLFFLEIQRYFSFNHPASGEIQQRFAAIVSRAVKVYVVGLKPRILAPSNPSGTSVITKRLASITG